MRALNSGAKVYKASYNSFRDYLKARWGIGKSQAYRLMEAAEAIVEAENVPQGLAEAENERQAREQISIASTRGRRNWRWKTSAKTTLSCENSLRHEKNRGAGQG